MFHARRTRVCLLAQNGTLDDCGRVFWSNDGTVLIVEVGSACMLCSRLPAPSTRTASNPTSFAWSPRYEPQARSLVRWHVAVAPVRRADPHHAQGLPRQKQSSDLSWSLAAHDPSCRRFAAVWLGDSAAPGPEVQWTINPSFQCVFVLTRADPPHPVLVLLLALRAV